MSDQRTHSVITTDGVNIVGTVHGQGPPLVFLPGGIGDGDLDWQALLPHLTGRFTCYLPSLRGRGLSGDHPDLRLGRLVDDLVAYVDSIGEATGLVGWSAGGMALAVAGQSDAVNAVAAVEPTMFSLMDDRERAVLGQAVARMGELAADGNMTAAVRAFLGFPFNDADIAVADELGYFEATGRYVPTLLNQLAQTMQSEGPKPDDPAVLGAIAVPVLVLHGADTKPLLAAGARHVADHVPNAWIQQVPGAGHASPLTHPEALAEALTGFFSPLRHDHMTSSSSDAGDELHEALRAFDDAFTNKRLDDIANLFFEDAQLLVHQQPAVSGRRVIQSAFARFFDQFDISSYETTYQLIDIHDDRAYTLLSFTQVLQPYGVGPGMNVHGRAVQFWRQEAGQWRLGMLLTARSAPDEQIA